MRAEGHSITKGDDMKKNNRTPLFLALLVAVSLPGTVFASQKVGLPEKKIRCQDIEFESVLNSHRIHFAPTVSGLNSFDIEVDKTTMRGREIYLNYIRKDCDQGVAPSAASCRFDFAIYRVLPDNSVWNTTEYLYLDFKNEKMTYENVEEGNKKLTNTALPASCSSLAQDYLEREEQLNQAYAATKK